MIESVRLAVQKIRQTDHLMAKNFRFLKYRTIWDLDELREKKETVKIPADVYGEPITITSDEDYKRSDGEIVIEIQDWYFLQFLSQKDFNALITVYKVFGGHITKFPNKEINDLLRYCTEMDKLLVFFFTELRKKGCQGVIEKLWKEMGGELIRADDRIGRRVTFIWGLVKSGRVEKLNTMGYMG